MRCSRQHRPTNNGWQNGLISFDWVRLNAPATLTCDEYTTPAAVRRISLRFQAWRICLNEDRSGFLKKRCGIIRNYHGNQRLATRRLRSRSTGTGSPAVLQPRLSPLTSYPNFNEQAPQCLNTTIIPHVVGTANTISLPGRGELPREPNICGAFRHFAK